MNAEENYGSQQKTNLEHLKSKLKLVNSRIEKVDYASAQKAILAKTCLKLDEIPEQESERIPLGNKSILKRIRNC